MLLQTFVRKFNCFDFMDAECISVVVSHHCGHNSMCTVMDFFMKSSYNLSV